MRYAMPVNPNPSWPVRIAKAQVSPVRQRTQYSCMSASMMMCLQACGHKVNEDEVNKVMGAKPMRGAAWEDALACAQHYGCRATLTVPTTVRQIKAWTDKNIPVMIAWNPEGRDWSHASVAYHVSEGPIETVDSSQTVIGSGPGLYVWVADPNIPNPEKTTRIVHEDDFYSRWYEKWPNYLVRRPACAISREITTDGRQVVAGSRVASDEDPTKDYRYFWSVIAPKNVTDRFLEAGKYQTRERRREMNYGEVSDAQARREQREIDRRDHDWWTRAIAVVEGVGTRQEKDAIKTHARPRNSWEVEDWGTHRELKKDLGKKYKDHLADVGFELFKNRDAMPLDPATRKKLEDSSLTVKASLQRPARWLVSQVGRKDPELTLLIGTGAMYGVVQSWGPNIDPGYPEMSVTTGVIWEIPIFIKDPVFGRKGTLLFKMQLGFFPFWDDKVRLIGLWESSGYDAVLGERLPAGMGQVDERRAKALPTIQKAVGPLAKYLRGVLDTARAEAEAKKTRSRKPAKPKTVVDSGSGDKFNILNQLADKVRKWPEGLAHVEKVKAEYKAGRNPSPDDLKKIRNYLYRNRMRDEANHFRQAAVASAVAARFLGVTHG